MRHNSDKLKLKNTPFVLIIRDGWGHNPYLHHRAFNAVDLAKTPSSDHLMAKYPVTLIHTDGEDVGLPKGTTGNSEVGHQNIGAGRIVFQEFMRILNAISSGKFFENSVLRKAINTAKKNNKAVHFMGIASDAGVHGVLYHLFACLEMCKRLHHDKVYLHLFMDGRDTGPYTGAGFVADVERMLFELQVGSIASVMGRYWSMDRDNRWERVERAYRCMTGNQAVVYTDPRKASPRVTDPDNRTAAWIEIAGTASEAIQRYYNQPMSSSQEGDEFITPTMIGENLEQAMERRIKANDTVIFYNYRGDRPRELVRAFVLDDFEGQVNASPDTGRKGFDRGEKLNVHFVTMTEYEESLNPFVEVMFPRQDPLLDIVGDYLSKLNIRQYRSAETEKYPHVTYFFNDYREEPFAGESRCMIQSPKVQTYDQQPEMSAQGVCEGVLQRLNSADCEEFLVINFANADMVGHTGKLDAAIKAVETVDQCVSEIVKATLTKNGSLIITADHGNAEQMWNPILDTPHTSHTLYQVPIIVVGEQFQQDYSLREGGRLADIVPTALDMIGLAKPKIMTGKTLLVKSKATENSDKK